MRRLRHSIQVTGSAAFTLRHRGRPPRRRRLASLAFRGSGETASWDSGLRHPCLKVAQPVVDALSNRDPRRAVCRPPHFNQRQVHAAHGAHGASGLPDNATGLVESLKEDGGGFLDAAEQGRLGELPSGLLLFLDLLTAGPRFKVSSGSEQKSPPGVQTAASPELVMRASNYFWLFFRLSVT